MELITINSVIQYINDEGEVTYERVLWLDAPSDDIVVFDLDDKQSFPVWKWDDLLWFRKGIPNILVFFKAKRSDNTKGNN